VHDGGRSAMCVTVKLEQQQISKNELRKERLHDINKNGQITPNRKLSMPLQLYLLLSVQ